MAVRMNREGFSSGAAFRGLGGPGVRVFQTVASQPSWVLRAAVGSAAAVLMAIMLIIVVPVLLVAVAVFVLGMLVTRARRWFAGLRRPNGVLDGRRNVRVIVPRGE
jgi:hypothetical protein